jgi:hypothetical protein
VGSAGCDDCSIPGRRGRRRGGVRRRCASSCCASRRGACTVGGSNPRWILRSLPTPDGDAWQDRPAHKPAAAAPGVRRGMASGLPPRRAGSSHLAAGRRLRGCCRRGAGFPLRGRYLGRMSCRGGCGRGMRCRCWTATPTRGCGRMAAGRSVHRLVPRQGSRPACGSLTCRCQIFGHLMRPGHTRR